MSGGDRQAVAEGARKGYEGGVTDTVPPKSRRGRPAYLTGGSRKGIPNKTTASIKQAFKEAFEQMGGAEALAVWGKANPAQFYPLAAKLIPTEVHAAVAVTDLRADDMGDDELVRIAAGSGDRTIAAAIGAQKPSVVRH